MLEKYIQQIITMELFADVVTIIDDKCIVRYFKVFRKEYVPIHSGDIVGCNFMDIYTNVKPETSTVLKALRGEPTYYNKLVSEVNGIAYEVMESIYPLELNGRIVGAVCIIRGIGETFEPSKKIVLQPLEKSIEYDNRLNVFQGSSTQMQSLKNQIEHIAATDVNVLIYGETGTGKELVAKALHCLSARNGKTFFSQNCAAIPPNLAETILFGSEKGVYTGSVSRAGILEMSAGGTVFLDEINSLDISVQAKLLKSLEEKQIRRLGSNVSVNTDFRVISATNEEPFECVKLGKIRRDLFYRLGTVIIEVPPLRSRGNDVIELAEYFIELHNEKNDIEILGLTKTAENILKKYTWPGNVRELKNAVEYALVFTRSSIITEDSLPGYILEAVNAGGNNLDMKPEKPAELQISDFASQGITEDMTLKEAVEAFEKRFLQKRLAENSNHSHLAKELGVTRQTLINKINRYGL